MSESDDGNGVPPRDGPAHEPVGSVGDEAAKLLGALSEWARDSGGATAGGLAGLAGQAAQAVSGIGAHVDTGAPECTYCPVCRTVHVVRSASPEVRAHLAAAASSFLQAVAGVLATLPPPPGGPTTPYERIDLDEDDPAEEEDDA